MSVYELFECPSYIVPLLRRVRLLHNWKSHQPVIDKSSFTLCYLLAAGGSVVCWYATSDTHTTLQHQLSTNLNMSTALNNLSHDDFVLDLVFDLWVIMTMPKSISRSINQSIMNQSVNQSINQSIMKQSMNQSMNQWINQSINESMNEWINQSITQSINQPNNQPTNQ